MFVNAWNDKDKPTFLSSIPKFVHLSFYSFSEFSSSTVICLSYVSFLLWCGMIKVNLGPDNLGSKKNHNVD